MLNRFEDNEERDRLDHFWRGLRFRYLYAVLVMALCRSGLLVSLWIFLRRFPPLHDALASPLVYAAGFVYVLGEITTLVEAFGLSRRV